MLFNKLLKNEAKSQKQVDRRAPDNKTPKVFSYYSASHKQLSNFKRHSTRDSADNSFISWFSFNKLFWLLIIIICFATVLYLSLLGNEPKIKINGDKYRNSEFYKIKVKEAISKDPRNRTKILLQKDQIQADLMKEFTEADNVSVSTSLLGHQIEVRINTNNAAMVIVQQANNLNSQNKSYIISDRGKLLISLKNTIYNYTKLPRIDNPIHIDIDEGDQLFKPEEAKALTLLHAYYKKDNIDKEINYQLIRSPQEIIVKESGRGFYVRYMLNDAIYKQYGAYKAALNKMESMGVQPSEYIDARLSEKIYFK